MNSHDFKKTRSEDILPAEDATKCDPVILNKHANFAQDDDKPATGGERHQVSDTLYRQARFLLSRNYPDQVRLRLQKYFDAKKYKLVQHEALLHDMKMRELQSAKTKEAHKIRKNHKFPEKDLTSETDDCNPLLKG